MTRTLHKGRRFPPAVIERPAWLCFRFTLGLRDFEEMFAHRGINAGYEPIRAGTVKFGPDSAANLRRRKQPPSPCWRLDEMVCKAGGERLLLWRAIDAERDVLGIVVQKHRDTRAALKLWTQLLRNQRLEAESIVADGHESCGPALRVPGRENVHRPCRLRENNRAESSHLSIRRRSRKMLGSRSHSAAQRVLTTHAAGRKACSSRRRMVSGPTLRIFRTRAYSVWARAVA
jgi:putative transposase